MKGSRHKPEQIVSTLREELPLRDLELSSLRTAVRTKRW
jgi:hypothetical protein